MSRTVQINRAPVLTLWASVVARRLGHARDAALTLGKAVAGLNAQAKGRRLGIYHPAEPSASGIRRSEEFWVDICGRPVPAIATGEGTRAVVGDKPISPAAVEQYLKRAFGQSLPAAEEAMRELAASYPPDELKEAAYGLYERFRPAIPPGRRGWGAKGELDLDLIESMAKKPAR